MRIIGLTGKAGAGKDTVADRLVEKHGFVKYALADPIKKMLDVIDVDCRTRETKELPHPVFGVSPRRMAQTLGTEWMRDTICSNGWLRLATQFIEMQRAHIVTFMDVPLYSGVVIPDIRFENEAQWLRDQGGELWHISRPSVAHVSEHSSENGVAFFASDFWIRNDSTLEHLHNEVDYFVEV